MGLLFEILWQCAVGGNPYLTSNVQPAAATLH
jgi:hypothetical protein